MATTSTTTAKTVPDSIVQNKYSKDRKVGEGTYAVVYLGNQVLSLIHI